MAGQNKAQILAALTKELGDVIMKLFSRIKAFFRYKGRDAEVEVSSAEIRQGKVYLHPVDDKGHVVCIKTSAVDILINANEDISESDVEILDAKKHAAQRQQERLARENTAKSSHQGSNRNKNALDYERPQMKKVSFTLYPDEYETLMDSINTHGYRKTEFLLACVSAAKKNSMEATYKKYINDHKARRTAEREAMRQAKKQANIQAAILQ